MESIFTKILFSIGMGMLGGAIVVLLDKLVNSLEKRRKKA
jgi:hypothetical protein